ncbi:MAG: hypothetical protein Q8K75_05295 [Chlamydiales bacterium]|nr:hypothetical protein [Chlamydiales bacterium]
MSSAEERLSQMESILTDLLTNAQKMVELSSKDTTALSQLMPLQELQQGLVEKLIAFDNTLHKECPNEVADNSLPAFARIEKCLEDFQRLNEQYIENVRQNQSVIQFEKESHPSHHKGTSPKASGSDKAIDSKNDHQNS